MNRGTPTKWDADEHAVKKCPLYCKYCGARLRRDYIGHKCPTRNCQWEFGVVGCEHHKKGREYD